MPYITPPTFLTAKDAAKRLGGRCNRATIVRLIVSGLMKGKKIGREWRILPEWLDEYMSQPDNVKEKS